MKRECKKIGKEANIGADRDMIEEIYPIFKGFADKKQTYGAQVNMSPVRIGGSSQGYLKLRFRTWRSAYRI